MLVVNRPARLLLNRSQACRRFSSSSSSSSSKLPLFLGVAAVTGGITYFTFRKSEAPTATVVQKPSVDYGAVAKGRDKMQQAVVFMLDFLSSFCLSLA